MAPALEMPGLPYQLLFPKAKHSLGAPDLEEHSLNKQAFPPPIPGVLQEITQACLTMPGFLLRMPLNWELN